MDSEPLPPATALAMSANSYSTQFDTARRTRLSTLGRLVLPGPVTDIDTGDPTIRAALRETEVLVTSWGEPLLTAERLDRMPRLEAVFHGAGSVRGVVTDAVWERGIVVTSAADANAVPVAEFTFASIVLAGKRAQYFARRPHQQIAEARGDRHSGRLGNHHGRVGLVGFSRIGRRVAEMLRALRGTEVLVSDPFARPEDVAALGARLVPLPELLPAVRVLSIHAPALPSTRHLIGRTELAALPDGATVVNTARGSLIDHDALLAECLSGRLDAVLDVTEPEPLPAGSPFFDLPNVSLTPHIAGSLGAEAGLLVDSALDEFEAWAAGRPLRHEVRPGDLASMA